MGTCKDITKELLSENTSLEKLLILEKTLSLVSGNINNS